MTTLLTPVDLSAAVQAGPRVFRKQVLAMRDIDYPMPDGTTRSVSFNREYLTDLAESYKAGAYDMVPFQLAGPDNRHNEDPRNYGGRVLGAEVTDDGLDVIVELSEDTAALVEKTGGRLGVSARIKEQLEHVDGRKFKRAIRHVLGTLDPRMQGLRPWEPVVDLSREDGDDVVDLSAFTYRGEMTMARIDTSRLTDDDVAQLESFAAASGIDLSVEYDDEPDLSGDEPERFAGDDAQDQLEDTADDDETDETDDESTGGENPVDEPLTDEELDALLDAEVAALMADESVSLSADDVDDDTLDLAAGMVGTADDETQVHRRDAATSRYQLARERYSRAGVPPFLLDLARPILEVAEDDTTSLDLASPATGDPIDVRGIVVGLLDAFRGTVDLSTETGHSHHDEAGEQTQTSADAWTDYLENN